jgi:hypothetical protein
MYEVHLRRKEEIRARIEKMTREKLFLEQLSPDEVIRLTHKKQTLSLMKKDQIFESHLPQSPKKKSALLRVSENSLDLSQEKSEDDV